MTRIPPHSIEAERSVLGSIMISGDALLVAAERLNPDDFFDARHQAIYRSMLDLDLRGREIDLISIPEQLGRDLGRAGGISYLASIPDSTPTSAAIELHTKIVAEKSRARRLLGAAREIVAECYEDPADIDDLCVRAEYAVSQAARGSETVRDTESARDMLTATVDAVRAAGERPDGVVGVHTGFADLDRITAGLQPSDLILVAGRPSMGKTSLGVQIGVYAAMDRGMRVLVFSVEMSRSALMRYRVIPQIARVDSYRVKTGRMDRDDWARFNRAVEQLNGSDGDLLICDRSGLGIHEARVKARRVASDGGLDLIVVDYVQLMHGSRRAENRDREIGEISAGLKALAKELNVPVVALSQLNRQLESRQDKRPMLSDLRESGNLEQDADLIIFVYRDEYYTRERCEKPGVAEVIVAKQRNGILGTVDLRWTPEFTRFDDLTRREPIQEDARL